jgi:hypothetical protein
MGGKPSRVRVSGPLVPYAAGFRAELEAQGYRPNAVCDQLRLMAHVSRWLASRGLGVGDLAPEGVEEFLVARRAGGYALWCSSKGVAPLLEYLRRLAVVAVPVPAGAATPSEYLLGRYRVYLVEERGLVVGTVASNLHVAGCSSRRGLGWRGWVMGSSPRPRSSSSSSRSAGAAASAPPSRSSAGAVLAPLVLPGRHDHEAARRGGAGGDFLAARRVAEGGRSQ